MVRNVRWCEGGWFYVTWYDVYTAKWNSMVWYGSDIVWHGIVSIWYVMGIGSRIGIGMHVSIYIYIYISLYVCVCVCLWVCVYVCFVCFFFLCVCVPVFFLGVCVCVWLCVHAQCGTLTSPSGVCQMRPTVRQYPEGCRSLSDNWTCEGG